MLPKIMIADDSMPLHALVKTCLEPEGLRIHSVYDGASAISVAGSLQPDLILLDVDMPQMDGFETCRQIKANPQTRSIPVMFLSADSVTPNKVKGLDLGAMDYIVKPFKPEELKARVRSALRAAHASDEAQIIDGLTGLWNKGCFEAHLKAQVSLAQRAARPLACIVADVDQLPAIRANFGETVANEFVRGVARLLLQRCRAEDTIHRLEGGTFAILTGDTNRFAARTLAERLRAEIEQQFRSGVVAGVNLTCSFGIADTLVATGTALLKRANGAANRANEKGGNCVSTARSPAVPSFTASSAAEASN
jgi:diguanylate cyclase (GGDEF)-like protein